MANFSKDALTFHYSWTRTEGDSKVTGFPDNILLNRNEGYEMLDFINKYMIIRGVNFSLPNFSLIERSIKNDIPTNLRSHAHVKEWLNANLINK